MPNRKIISKSKGFSPRVLAALFVGVFVVAIGLTLTAPPTGLSAATQSTSSTNTNTLTVVPDDLPLNILFGTQATPANNSASETIPANTLVWSSYTVSNQLYVLGAGTQVRATSENYNSNVTIAAYVNGALVDKQTYIIPPASAPPSSNGNSLPRIYQVGLNVPITATVSAGSTVSLSFLSSTSITMYVNSSGQAYESAATSVPQQLPSTSGVTTLPYAPDIYAYGTNQ